MTEELTSQQSEFVTRFKSRVSSGKFITEVFIKIGEEDSNTYNTFKQWLFEYCMANDIYFLETRYFIIVGLSQKFCEILEAEASKQTADAVSKLLHSLGLLDTVKNVN